VIEVGARIGDSIVNVAHVPAGGSYRAHDGSLLVVAGRVVTPAVTIGLVSYTIARAERAGECVPRPRVERRMYGYVAASLAVQLAIWLVAVTTAPFEKLERPVYRIVRLTHVHAAVPPPKPKKPPTPVPEKPSPDRPKPTASSVHASAAHHRTADPDEAAGSEPAEGITEGEAIARLGKTFDDIDVAGQLAKTDGPLVDASTEPPGAFGGGGHHFNADAVAPEQTYAVGRWALPTFIRTHKGELAPVPAIEWCDEGSCMARGSLPIDRVLAILARHEKQIAQCYREHTGDLAGTVRVRFPVGADGRVIGTLGTQTGPVGYGTGTVGRCIAKIAQGIRWPQARDETYVFVGLAFRPASG
jgi:hypothetical protein